MMSSPIALAPSQLTQLLGGIQFSTDSTAIVPGIADYDGSSDAFCAPFSEIPEEYSEFVRMSETAHKVSVETRVGTALWNGNGINWGNENGETMRLEMANVATCGDPVLGGSLLFYSREPQFAITQSNYLPKFDGTKAPVKTRGSAITEVSTGVRLLNEVSRMAKNRDDQSWEKLTQSFHRNEFVTPMTAFYLASIVSQEVLWGHFSKINMMANGESYDISKGAGYRGALVLPRGIYLNEHADRTILFSSAEKRVNGYSLQRGFYFEPSVTVEFHPGRTGNAPRIHLAHRTMFSRRGTEPIAETIADMMIAAATMHPQSFPLRNMDMN